MGVSAAKKGMGGGCMIICFVFDTFVVEGEGL